MSGRQDSNLRPPGPKPGAITNYATPRIFLAIANLLQFFTLQTNTLEYFS